MTDPTNDHSRVSPQGRAMGKSAARLADLGLARLAELGLDGVKGPGLRDEMCKSCACRLGAVPNGCSADADGSAQGCGRGQAVSVPRATQWPAVRRLGAGAR
ncbi:hypothetical protein PEC18_05095 [Paucibacter sp. O1-1]|nr:hypothetical protein [Paucibacter sp. O1-1]MDA3825246.1 hypothetical protein [Paucibacter sp. O1-1]